MSTSELRSGALLPTGRIEAALEHLRDRPDLAPDDSFSLAAYRLRWSGAAGHELARALLPALFAGLCGVAVGLL